MSAHVSARHDGSCTAIGYDEPDFEIPQHKQHNETAWRNVALCVAIALPLLLTVVSPSFSKGKCEYPDVLSDAFVSPERRAGEFRIKLAPPDYSNKTLVQEHLVFSTIFARALSSDLKRSTSNRCEAIIIPSVFPDLHVYLISNHRSGDAEAHRSSCRQALRESALHLDLDETLIRSSADDEARLRSQVISSPAGEMSYASNILTSALSRIHDADTVLSALYSISPDQFHLLEVEAFGGWLKRKREVGDAIVSVETICAPVPGPPGPNAEPATNAFPYSSIARPGAIKISRKEWNHAFRRQMKHLVVVGHYGIRNAPDTAPLASVKARFCNARYPFPPDNGSQGNNPATVRIRCLTSVAYDNDAWTILFCDPGHCTSERAALAIATALMGEADIAALANDGARFQQPRGPYMISIETPDE